MRSVCSALFYGEYANVRATMMCTTSREKRSMRRTFVWLVIFSSLSFVGCAPKKTAAQATPSARSNASSCDIATASPWISRWLSAWELTSREILHLPDAPPPTLVFFDSSCVYTTSAVTAAGRPAQNGPALYGKPLPWRAFAHDGTITQPDSSTIPIALMSFASLDRKTGPYFVMAAPSYWAQQKGLGPEPPTPVFLHEFAHTRQVQGMGKVIDPIDSTWAYPEELDDDAVQTHFGDDSTYVAAYIAERDLLYRAAEADSLAEVRAMAAQVLAMIRARQDLWFVGDKAVFAVLDDTFLSMEGAAQWAAYAWLAHPAGGGLDKTAAAKKMVGKRRRWTQDEGLALFLVIDRLLPEWPSLVFRTPSMGAVELLERAVQP